MTTQPPRTILITGATDGIGRQAAQRLVEQGHTVLVHGRSQSKLDALVSTLGLPAAQAFRADLGHLDQVDAMAEAIRQRHDRLDVLINNAGVLKAPNTATAEGYDLRFMVNTLAPYRLTQPLLPLMDGRSRVVNLSSAAQRPVNLRALQRGGLRDDMGAYAQSKLALTMWSCHVGRTAGAEHPVMIALNPGSFLGTKMVREGFGMAGHDVGIGAQIIVRCAVDPAFANARGIYFDNDAQRIGPPHPDALDDGKCASLVAALAQLAGVG
jgi:NAD(P)-dependent dehydrogenase (short-subunit alcohol dehydrogenase family)